eukprot:gene20402-biopygen8551
MGSPLPSSSYLSRTAALVARDCVSLGLHVAVIEATVSAVCATILQKSNPAEHTSSRLSWLVDDCDDGTVRFGKIARVVRAKGAAQRFARRRGGENDQRREKDGARAPPPPASVGPSSLPAPPSELIQRSACGAAFPIPIFHSGGACGAANCPISTSPFVPTVCFPAEVHVPPDFLTVRQRRLRRRQSRQNGTVGGAAGAARVENAPLRKRGAREQRPNLCRGRSRRSRELQWHSSLVIAPLNKSRGGRWQGGGTNRRGGGAGPVFLSPLVVLTTAPARKALRRSLCPYNPRNSTEPNLEQYTQMM